MRKNLFSVIIGSFCMLGLTAQNQVVDPPEFANREGVSSYRYAAGNRQATPSNRVWQWQQIHDNLAKNNAVNIKGMAFRRDANAAFHWNAWSAQMELKLSTCPLTSQSYSTTFANNRGLDEVTVIAKKWVKFPPMLRTLAMPEPFLVRLPFDLGKSFSLAKGAVLSWHWVGYDNDLYTSGGAHCYLDRDYQSDYSPTKALPGGCFALGWSYFRPMYCTTSCWHNKATDKLHIYGYTDHGPCNALAIHGIGLPFKPEGTYIPVGGPDFFNQPCRLFINPGSLNFSLPYQLNNTGYYSTPKETPFWILPNDPLFYDVKFWSQSFSVDPVKSVVYISNVDVVMPHYQYPLGKSMGISFVEVAELNRHTQAWSNYHVKNGGLITQFQL